MIFEVLSQPSLIMLVMLGTALGITVGSIPGLTGAMLISLTLPLTFSMDGQSALALLVAMYVGSVSGGLITATLLKMPGTPASIITTLDGYPMASSGRASRALGLASASLRHAQRRPHLCDTHCNGPIDACNLDVSHGDFSGTDALSSLYLLW